jgi:hypothetical protein
MSYEEKKMIILIYLSFVQLFLHITKQILKDIGEDFHSIQLGKVQMVVKSMEEHG